MNKRVRIKENLLVSIIKRIFSFVFIILVLNSKLIIADNISYRPSLRGRILGWIGILIVVYAISIIYKIIIRVVKKKRE